MAAQTVKAPEVHVSLRNEAGPQRCRQSGLRDTSARSLGVCHQELPQSHPQPRGTPRAGRGLALPGCCGGR